MTGATFATSRRRQRRTMHRYPTLAFILVVTSALAGCTSLGSLSPEKDDTTFTPSQSNLASLTEVIEKHPEDPQAYNMRGSVFAETGRTEQALADFNKEISLAANYDQY